MIVKNERKYKYFYHFEKINLIFLKKCVKKNKKNNECLNIQKIF